MWYSQIYYFTSIEATRTWPPVNESITNEFAAADKVIVTTEPLTETVAPSTLIDDCKAEAYDVLPHVNTKVVNAFSLSTFNVDIPLNF